MTLNDSSKRPAIQTNWIVRRGVGKDKTSSDDDDDILQSRGQVGESKYLLIRVTFVATASIS